MIRDARPGSTSSRAAVHGRRVHGCRFRPCWRLVWRLADGSPCGRCAGAAGAASRSGNAPRTTMRSAGGDDRTTYVCTAQRAAADDCVAAGPEGCAGSQGPDRAHDRSRRRPRGTDNSRTCRSSSGWLGGDCPDGGRRSRALCASGRWRASRRDQTVLNQLGLGRAKVRRESLPLAPSRATSADKHRALLRAAERTGALDRAESRGAGETLGSQLLQHEQTASRGGEHRSKAARPRRLGPPQVRHFQRPHGHADNVMSRGNARAVQI